MVGELGASSDCRRFDRCFSPLSGGEEGDKGIAGGLRIANIEGVDAPDAVGRALC